MVIADVAAVVEGALHPSSSHRRMQGCSQAAGNMANLLQPVLQDRQLSAHSMQQLFEESAGIASSGAELGSMLQQAGADLCSLIRWLAIWKHLQSTMVHVILSCQQA